MLGRAGSAHQQSGRHRVRRDVGLGISSKLRRNLAEACPDIAHYARNGISSWRDLVATAATVRSIIGISPSGWEDANIDLGPEDSAVLVAASDRDKQENQSVGLGHRRPRRRHWRAEYIQLSALAVSNLTTSHMKPSMSASERCLRSCSTERFDAK